MPNIFTPITRDPDKEELILRNMPNILTCITCHPHKEEVIKIQIIFCVLLFMPDPASNILTNSQTRNPCIPLNSFCTFTLGGGILFHSYSQKKANRTVRIRCQWITDWYCAILPHFQLHFTSRSWCEWLFCTTFWVGFGLVLPCIHVSKGGWLNLAD